MSRLAHGSSSPVGSTGYSSEREESDDSGDSLSGEDIDDARTVTRLLRPDSATGDSAYSIAVASASASSSASVSKSTNKNQRPTLPPRAASTGAAPPVVVDYRAVTQQKAKEEMLRATGSATTASSSSPQTSKRTAMREVVPEAAKNAFARPSKNAKPMVIDIGPINVEEQRKKMLQQQIDDAAAKSNNKPWESQLRSNSGAAVVTSPSSAKQHVDPKRGDNNKLNVAPSQLAIDIFATSSSSSSHTKKEQEGETGNQNSNRKSHERVDNNNNNNNNNSNNDDSRPLDTNAEDVELHDDDDDMEGRQQQKDKAEFYEFLDYIVKNNKSDSERKTFAVPFDNNSSSSSTSMMTDAQQNMSEADLKSKELAIRAANQRNIQMYTALARIASGSNKQKGGGGGGGYHSSTAADVAAAAHTDDYSVEGNAELQFHRARAFLEGLLLQDSFVDTVNGLLDRAVPAFKFTKYTRGSGEFTLEQHRQWERYCKAIEQLVLKKLHVIMDVTEFFQRIFDEEDDDSDDSSRSNSGDDDEKDDNYRYDKQQKRLLSHDAWELVLSVLKFEHFCSLMDSYIESCTTEEEQEEEQEARAKALVAAAVASSSGGELVQSSGAAVSSSSTSTSLQQQQQQQQSASTNNNNNNNTNKPRATLFHALPRAGGGGGGGGTAAAPRTPTTMAASSMTTRSSGGGDSRSSSTSGQAPLSVSATTRSAARAPLGQVQPKANPSSKTKPV